ncbi:MAG: 1-acyl-sn-glycerol-3-phosphate acyltransferase [Hydrogenophaga sp.]|nr:1-acyl-sn-glycerol-3-phosphate acyltransferase [Hydrogenophaga sp.]
MSASRRSAVGAGWRILRALAHVFRGLWIIRSEFGRLNQSATDLLVREWSRQMLDILGVTLEVRGEVPAHGPLLQVANHISWLDILVLNAARPVHFVSKADVKAWPVLGSLVTGAGTLYIERESRRDAMRVVHRMAERLREHDILAVFPEGTTGDGQVLLPFHANLIQAAIAVQSPVQPVGLSYVDAATRQRHAAPLFIGDTTLLASLWNTLRATDVHTVVNYGVPQAADGRDRRAWAQVLRDAVDALREG